MYQSTLEISLVCSVEERKEKERERRGQERLERERDEEKGNKRKKKEISLIFQGGPVVPHGKMKSMNNY